MTAPDPQHLDLDAIEKRRASASEWLLHQPSNSIGWGSTAWVVDADVPALISRVQELGASIKQLEGDVLDLEAENKLLERRCDDAIYTLGGRP